MKRLIASIIIVMLSSVFAVGADLKTITVAGDAYPPFVDPQNPKEGLSLEVLRAALKTQGYVIKMEYVPWARAEAGVKKGSYDILPDVWMTDARKKELMFSKSYVSNKIKFITLKDNPFEYDGINSLKGKTVGTVRGYGYSDEFNSSTIFERDEVADFIQNIKKMIAKRSIDMTLEDEIVAKVIIAQEDPKLLEQVRFTKNAFLINDLYIASGLKNPRHKEFIEAFNKGLDTIKADGTYAKILESYGIK